VRYAIDAVNRGLEMPFAEAQRYEATLFGLAAATDDMREGTTGVPREAQARVQGALDVRPDSDGRRAVPDAAGLPLRHRRVAVQPRGHRIAAAAAREALGRGRRRRGVETLHVPGAFELPQAARCLAETGRFDAVVCLGCVMRGETPHFDYISSAVAHGHHARRRSTRACRSPSAC
jgi:hypothetical protein